MKDNMHMFSFLTCLPKLRTTCMCSCFWLPYQIWEQNWRFYAFCFWFAFQYSLQYSLECQTGMSNINASKGSMGGDSSKWSNFLRHKQRRSICFNSNISIWYTTISRNREHGSRTYFLVFYFFNSNIDLRYKTISCNREKGPPTHFDFLSLLDRKPILGTPLYLVIVNMVLLIFCLLC